MREYCRFTFTEREEVSRYVAAGLGCRAIARKLKRAPSTISRELCRLELPPVFYRAFTAQKLAMKVACVPRRPKKLLINAELRAYVHKGLLRRWSPEQIAKRLAAEYPCDTTMRLSHETIYTYLYVLPRGELKRELIRYLRHRRKKRRSRRAVHDRRGAIPDMISIEERPKEVEDRTVPGHWEGDLVMGRRHASALGTLVERTTRSTILVPLKTKDASSVRRAFTREMKTLPKQMARSLTCDRGKEMTEHKLFTRDTQIQVFFAHPHSPWERGTNENTNGLIRQFFPKGTDFSKVPRREIKRVQALLNGRPRKVLNFRTPSEVFHNQPVALGA